MKLFWKRIRNYALASALAIGAGCGLFLIETGDSLADDSKWERVGGAELTAGEAWEPSLFMDHGTPYAAYTVGSAVTVTKYNGSGWEPVGSSIPSVSSSWWHTPLYVDNGTPYIAYSDSSQSGKVTVKKFNGSSWELVGSAGISANIVKFISLYVDNGTPYVAYKDYGHSRKATVKKFNGTEWVTVGSEGISTGEIYNISLQVNNGAPYVAYSDDGNSGKGTVMTYDEGSGWVPVGGVGFTPSRADYLSLDIDRGTLYLAYMDFSVGAKATVQKYNGSSWETVGNAGFSASVVDYTSLYVDNGTPYVAYQDDGNSSKATVMKYNGSSWESVGSPGFSAGTVEFVSLDGYNGIPYVLYKDLGNGNKVTVMKMKFSVGYDGNGSTGGTAPVDSNGYDKNADATVLGNTGNLVKTGHVFTGWNTEPDGSGASYGPGDLVNVGDSGVRLYAKWAIGSYSVTYDRNGATDGSVPLGSSYQYNSIITLPGNTGNLVKTGYTFAGWKTAADGSGTDYPVGSAYTIGPANVALYAKWTINSYSVTYDSNGATFGSVPASGNHNYNTNVTVPGNSGGLAKTGYTFAGWNTAADGNGTNYVGSNTFTIGASNVTLYAKWTINSYTVTYDSNGATSGSVPADSSHDYNAGVTVPGNPGGLAKTGHTFAGWNTAADGSGTIYDEADGFTIGASNVTLYANWTVNNYTVSFESNGGTPVASQTMSYGGTAVQPAAPTMTGHTFAGWYTDAGLTAAYDFAAPIGAADVTLYAKWTVNSYTVTYDGNGSDGGSVPTDSSHDYNTSVTVPGNSGGLSKTGHALAGWMTAADGSGTDYAESDAFTMGAGDVTLYAKWTVNQYTVGFESNGGSSVSSQTIDYGSTAAAPADPTMTGHTFAGWYTDADLTAAYDFAAPIGAADVTLYAKWTVNSYTVTYDGNGAASGSAPAASSHDYNTSVTVPGNSGGLAKTGHTFAGWNTAADGSGTDYAESESFTIGAEDVTLYANWTINSYAVTYDGNGAASGSVPAASSHEYSTSVTVPGNPGGLSKTGHTFAGWNTAADGSGTNYAESEPFTIGAENVTLYAKWTINSYAVTYDGNGSDGGSVPAASSHVYNASVTVPGNPGGLAKTGHTFEGWNTAADGSGTDYAESEPLTIPAADVTLYAKWTVNGYTVIFESNGGSPMASQTVSYGSTAVRPADPTKTGHTFAGWYTDADLTAAFDFEAPIGAADVTLYAKWAVNQYTVGFESNGGSSVSSQTIDYGSTAAVPAAPTKTGHTFAGWYTDADLTAAYDFAAPIGAADVTLYAKWTVNSYTVTYDGNGRDGGSVPTDSSHDYNTSVIVPGNSGGLAKTGHTFAGWNTAADGSGTNYAESGTFTISAADVTLYAVWTVNSYAVTYDGNGAASGSVPAASGHEYNTSVTVPGNPGGLSKTGHTFAGWNTAADGSGTNYAESEPFTIGAADVTLYAKWTINSYAVTYDGNGSDGGSVPAASSHVYNASVTVPGNPGGLAKTGHTFAGWNTAADGSGTDYAESEPLTIPAADVTLYAKWTVNGYTVIFESDGGSPVASQTVSYGSTAVRPADPTKTGHTFAGWYTDANLTAAFDFEAPIGAADVTLYAKWTINSYAVTYDGNGSDGGSVPANSSHDYNTGVAVPGNPGGLAKTGHTFAGWNTAADGSGTDYAVADTFTIGPADVTLYAKWTGNSYTIIFESNGGTPVDSQTVSYGSMIVRPADPTKTGHTFAGWYVDPSVTAAVDFAAPIGAADVTLYAKWTINSYTVTYDGNGATSGSVPADSSHDYNAGVTVPGNPGGLAKTGHTFAGWNTAADGSGTIYDEADGFTIGASNATLYANWTVNNYTVSFESNGGTPVASQTMSYGGTAVQPADPTMTGHTFAGWYTNAGLTAAYDFAAPIGAADVTLYAKWTINSYTVTYDGNGAASGSVPADSSHDYNADVTVPGNSGGLAKTGHTFAGWNSAADGSGTNYDEADGFTIGASNVTLYANWTVNNYTVSFESNGGTPVASQTMSYGGTAVQPAAPTKTGHTFAGWYTDADLTAAYDFAAPIGAADVTLYAKWTVNSYTVTYDGNGSDGGSVPTDSSHDYNADVTVPGNSGGLAKTGHTFAGWNRAADGSGTNYAESGTFTISAADVTLYAKWTINSYAVTYDGNGAASGSVPAASSHEYNTSVTVPGNPGGLSKTGHTFAGWNTAADGSGTNYAESASFTIGAEDVTLYAKWTINGYAVTYDGNGSDGGSVPAASSHVYNASVTVPGNPGGLAKTGHTFAGWNTAADGSGTDYAESEPLTIPAADVTLYAKWTVNGYTVIFESDGGSPMASQTVSYGSTAVRPADPTKTGHTFAGWYTDADLTAAFDFEAPIGAADVTLYAKWTINSYAVTYDGNGSDGGSVPANSSHDYNTGVAVPGNPGGLAKTGHTFAGWNTAADGSGTGFAAGDTLTIPAADVTLYAIWTANQYTIRFESNGGSPVNSQAVSFGSTPVEPTAPTKAGYAFAGWYTDPEALTQPFDLAAPIGAADVTLYAKWFSANALLSELTADQGTLRPAFSPFEASYVIEVPNAVTNLNLFLRKGDPAQSITVTGATYSSVTDDVYSYNVSGLTVGPNPIRISVTAENQDRNTYHLTVNVSADEAMGQPVALNPAIRTLTFPGGLAIRLPDGLSIPPGATLTVRDSNAAPSGEVKLARAGQVIDFQFEGMTIDRPVEITLGYDGNTDPSKLAIFYYNESTGKWEYQPSQVTDNGIKTSVGHFSTYGVLADTTAPDRATVASGEKTTSSIALHLSANDDSGVAIYLIYRDGTLVAETAESTYVDTGLSASRTYTYTVKAVDRLGNRSGLSESITAATNGSGNGGGGSGAPGGMVSNPDKVTSTDGRLTIPAGKSGEVSLSDKVKIAIPAGASDVELKVTIEQVTDTQKLIKSNEILLSPIFEILKNVANNFSKDVTLTFAFDPTSVTDKQKPSVFYYDEWKKVWVKVGGEVSGNTIAASVNHFTKFAVFAVDQETESVPDEKPTMNLSDISGHWAEESIRAAVGAGIVEGYADGTFKPNADVTRAEFAVMLMNALKPWETGTEMTFADTAEIGAWASTAVAQAVEAGIVTGYGDGRFRPAANISRAELAVMIARAYGADIETEATAPTGFSDDKDIPVWAKGGVFAVRQSGIVQGRSGGMFAPNATATRAEAVTIIMNLLQKMN